MAELVNYGDCDCCSACCDPPSQICFTATNIRFQYPSGYTPDHQDFLVYKMTLDRVIPPPAGFYFYYTGTAYLVGGQTETTINVTCEPALGVTRGEFYDQVELFPGPVTKTGFGGNILDVVSCEPFVANYPLTGPKVLLASGDVTVTCDSATITEGPCP